MQPPPQQSTPPPTAPPTAPALPTALPPALPDELSFRRATLADAPAVIDLVTSAYRGEASRQGWTSEADLIAGQRIDLGVLSEDIRRPASVVLLAERSGSLVGCAHVRRTDEGQAYFGMFAVRPLGQARGDGTRILTEAERFVVAEWAAGVMTMTVLEGRTELLSFYERRGYRRTGRYQPFPYGDTRFGLPRRPDLRFEILDKNLNRTDGLTQAEEQSGAGRRATGCS